MQIIYYLIPVAIIFVILGVFAFFWATKNEQFEDLEKHGLSLLMDDDVKKTQNESSKQNSTNETKQ